MKKIAGGLLLAPFALFAVACGPSTSSTGSGPVLTAPSFTPSAATAPMPSHPVHPTHPVRPAHSVHPAPAKTSVTVTCHVRFDSAGDPLPDPNCTPGAVLTTSVMNVCSPDWAGKHREEFSKAAREAAYARYGIITTDPAGYGEYDHLIPLELGGSNSSKNLWPEAGKIPNAKDAVEDALHKAVCAGKLSLTQAQHDIAQNWVTAGTKDIEAGSGLKAATHAPKATFKPATTAPRHITTTACSPKTSGGNCYEPGEFCSKAEHSESGVAGDGKSITCKQVGKSWRWEA